MRKTERDLNTFTFHCIYQIQVFFFWQWKIYRFMVLFSYTVTLGGLWTSWLGPHSLSEQLCQPHPLRWPATHPHLYWSQRRWGYSSSLIHTLQGDQSLEGIIYGWALCKPRKIKNVWLDVKLHVCILQRPKGVKVKQQLQNILKPPQPTNQFILH